MSAINSDTRDAWQAMATEVSKQRPSQGKRVKVVGGRKHKGKEGIVLHHMVSRFVNAFRYASDAQATLREMAGRYGYVVRVDTGCETFWVDADKVEVLP